MNTRILLLILLITPIHWAQAQTPKLLEINVLDKSCKPYKQTKPSPDIFIGRDHFERTPDPTRTPTPTPELATSLIDPTALYCFYTYQYSSESEFNQALIDLPKDPDHAYVGENQIMSEHAIPNDTYYAGNAGMKFSYDDLWNIKMISAEKAWEKSTGKNIIIAVIDSGVDFSHPDAPSAFINDREIAGNNIDDDKNGYIDDVSGWDFTRNKPDQIDESGHGTHVSGIIAAKGNNSLGIVGVAYEAKILSLRTLKNDGKGGEDSVVRALAYAQMMGAKIINLSLGGKGDSPLIQRALQQAKNNNILVIDSSGNAASDTADIFPAKYPETLTVGSIMNDGKTLSTFSNYGVAIDLVAGGGGDAYAKSNSTNILSLMSSSVSGTQNFLITENSSARYSVKSGTSMAAPLVTGVAALVWSANPSLTADQVKLTLISSAKDLGDSGKDLYFGYGLVNAEAAVDYALSGQVPTYIENSAPAGDDGFFGCTVKNVEQKSATGFMILIIVTLLALIKYEKVSDSED